MSLLVAIYLKCQIRFSWKNKKNLISLLCADFALRVVKVKLFFLPLHGHDATKGSLTYLYLIDYNWTVKVQIRLGETQLISVFFIRICRKTHFRMELPKYFCAWTVKTLIRLGSRILSFVFYIIDMVAFLALLWQQII